MVKVGRTHLQDATPVRMGQVFGGWAAQTAHAAQRLALAWDGLLEVALGGTAVGTGIGRDPEFHVKALAVLSERTGVSLRKARNPFEALGGREACVFFAGALAAAAAALSKVANDVRFLGSGPRCGLGELKLPELQPGSSIMPGKVNPVMSESLIMACMLVAGLRDHGQRRGRRRQLRAQRHAPAARPRAPRRGRDARRRRRRLRRPLRGRHRGGPRAGSPPSSRRA